MRFLTWNIQGGGGRRVSSILQELERLAPDFVTLTEVTFNNLGMIKAQLSRQGFGQIETTCSERQTNSILRILRASLAHRSADGGSRICSRSALRG